MKGLLPLWHAWQRAYFRWALREMGPMHPDTPDVVRRIAHLEATR